MPTPGNRKKTLRVEPELWDAFVTACPEAERGHESGAAKVLREFIAWYVHKPGAKQPRRPPVAAWKGRKAKGDHPDSSPPD